MSDQSPVLALPYIQPSQAQKHVTHNAALRILDALVQLSVEALLSDPPIAPEPGARYIVGQAATGDWAGRDGAVALWQETGWQFHIAQAGWRAWRRDSRDMWLYDGGVWDVLTTLPETVPQLGVNAAPDMTNRFATSAEASLFTHEGGGHQIKINKSTPAETASLLFQTGWTGHAEMGISGSDDFAIKVSGDGALWHTALSVDAQSGAPDLATGATIGGQAAYGRGNVLGPVSETAGQPTGAVIERGSTGQGGYVRFADGTQICTGDVTTSASAGVIWTFPRPFAAAPHVTGTMVVAAPQFLTADAAGTGDVTLHGWDHGGARIAAPAQVVATGRWV